MPQLGKFAISALAVVVSAAAAQAQTYLCIADMGTGFSYSNASRTWETTRFDVKDKRYLVKKTEKGWVWSNFGEPSEHLCEGNSLNGFIGCDGDGRMGIKFFVDRLSMRYQKSYLYGYLHNPATTDAEADTPLIEIGRCSVL
jgi:hypothetical protein